MIMFHNYPFVERGCKKDTNYARYFLGQPRDRMGFFAKFSPSVNSCPSEIPFRTILSCFESDPQLRPTMEDLAVEPFFQVRPLSTEEGEELAELLA